MPRCVRLRLAMRVISRSNRLTEPASGASSPVIRLNSVVFPAPFGPMMSRRSPGSTLSLTLRVTRRPPNDLLKLLMTSALIPPLRGNRRHRLAPARRLPKRAYQPRCAGYQTFRHEYDDGNENSAQHEIPAFDIGADDVFDDDDEGGANHWSEQRPCAAGDHHQ